MSEKPTIEPTEEEEPEAVIVNDPQVEEEEESDEYDVEVPSPALWCRAGR